MQSSYQKAMAQYNRETLAEIEAKLHPCPIINGCEIRHQHKRRTGEIVFTAWKNGNRVNDCWITMDRIYVKGSKDFYKEFEKLLAELTTVQLPLELDK